MKELDKFMAIAKTTYNETMKNWKQEGGKIIGYFCPNVPEEIIIAAGMLPIRLRAPESTQTVDAERYLSPLNCSYCRHVLDEAINGKYDFLDGFVGTNGCDQIRRTADAFRATRFKDSVAKKEIFYEFVNAPRVIDDDVSRNYYKEELVRLKDGMAQYFGVDITDNDLKSAIKLVNESRRLVMDMYMLRKAQQPPISGEESLAVTVSFSSMPKTGFNENLKGLLGSLNGRVALPEAEKRIFLYGGELDDLDFVKLIEGQGAIVVADGLCFGARQVWESVDESLDPMDGITNRYLTRWSCPRNMDPLNRVKRVRDAVRDWNVDGIVGLRMVFCQSGGAERTLSNLDAKETGMPTLWLDREYRLTGEGQLKTRIQAFLESLD